jgi:hypothetical protein
VHFASFPARAGQRLPELDWLERLIDAAPRGVVTRTLCDVEVAGQRLPVHALCLGNPDRDKPAIGFFGGVHGLERIGTHVLLHFLEDLFVQLATDLALNYRLEHMRLVFMPLVNPGGMLGTTRCNPQGVDLMRNGPVDATSKVPFLIGGQRLTPRLPWYRGADTGMMEPESHALCRLVEDELLGRKFAVALDCHSGFGFRDRIWFPYAHTTTPIHHLPEIHALTALFEQRHPEHNYVIEPQSHQYLAHGDLWDHLYRSSLAQEGSVFLPLTLEMGSWRWVSKYPRQLLSKLGMFNPLPAARRDRVLRNHLPWLEFLIRMGSESANWLPAGAARAAHANSASARWYRQVNP